MERFQVKWVPVHAGEAGFLLNCAFHAPENATNHKREHDRSIML